MMQDEKESYNNKGRNGELESSVVEPETSGTWIAASIGLKVALFFAFIAILIANFFIKVF